MFDIEPGAILRSAVVEVLALAGLAVALAVVVALVVVLAHVGRGRDNDQVGKSRGGQ